MRRIKLWFKGLWYKFTNSQFVAHISFLWHWKNFFFFLKYPFWREYDRWTSKFMGYKYNAYDLLPRGWKIAFGKQLSDDIKQAGKESRKRLGYKTWKNLITWEDIKEKWGSLRLYARTTEEIMHVLEKYEYMSYGYCIFCGQPVRYITKNWVSYQCEKCFSKDLDKYVDEKERQRVLNEHRLKVKDLPQGTSYSKNKQGKVIAHKINYKRIYGVDLRELWGLDK